MQLPSHQVTTENHWPMTVTLQKASPAHFPRSRMGLHIEHTEAASIIFDILCSKRCCTTTVGCGVFGIECLLYLRRRECRQILHNADDDCSENPGRRERIRISNGLFAAPTRPISGRINTISNINRSVPVRNIQVIDANHHFF